jgi:signal transduction histidine kinase
VSLVVVDPDDSVRETNAAARALFGESLVRAGRPVDELGAAAEGGELQALFEEVRRSGRSNGRTLWLRTTRRDRVFPARVELAGAPSARDPGGGPPPLLLCVVELEGDEQREVERRLLQSQQRKDEFLAMLANELRNPLAPLQSLTQLVEQRPQLVQHNSGIARSMQRQVDRILRLADDLGDATRIARGDIVLRRAPLDLVELVRTQVVYHRETLEESAHSLVLDLPQEPVTLVGDADRLHQVLANLLDNAIRYTDPGGQLRIALERQSVSSGAAAPPAGRGGSGSPEVILRVEDSGAGIPPESQQAIFQPFQRLREASASEEDRSYRRRGAGIGLALARALIRSHGGTIEVESEGVDQGSAFIVRLPAVSDRDHPRDHQGEVGADPTHRPAPGAMDEPASRTGGRRSAVEDAIAGAREEPPEPHLRARVLVVDDDRDAAESLAALLEFEGHEVRYCTNPFEALEMTPGYHPQVTFVDIGMPVMDGIELARRLRRQPGGRDTVLVAFTGWAEPEGGWAQEGHFDDHLLKPPELRRLTRIIEAALERGLGQTPG